MTVQEFVRGGLPCRTTAVRAEAQPASNTPSTYAPTEASAVTAPHTSSVKVDLERWWSEGSGNLLGRTTAERPHRREKAGDYKLTTYPDCRGENMERQASGVQGVGEGGELHVGSLTFVSFHLTRLRSPGFADRVSKGKGVPSLFDRSTPVSFIGTDLLQWVAGDPMLSNRIKGGECPGGRVSSGDISR